MIAVHIPKQKILLPYDWRPASASHGVLHRFRITARFADGAIQWRGWFEDRGDADEFLLRLATNSLSRSDYHLPSPSFPGIHPGVTYDFVTLTFLTSISGSNQTAPAVAVDWNSGNNKIETIAAGGGGSGASIGAANSFGAGGGAYGKALNVGLIAGATPTFHNENGGAGSTGAGGNPGDTWYNGASLAASSVGSKAGVGGFVSGGGTGGAAASGRGGIGGGTTNPGAPYAYSGGGSGSGNGGGCGGGGAGGPLGAGAGGNAGNAVANFGGGGGGGNGGGSGGTAGNASNGGAGGNNNGGTGGGGGGGGVGTNGGGGGGGNSLSGGGAGGMGTEFDATHGSGGGGAGGGGHGTTGATGPGGTAAAGYGGGGGGAGYSPAGSTGSGGSGGQGVVVLTNFPAQWRGLNQPMLGM